jgi:hypothetical protein
MGEGRKHVARACSAVGRGQMGSRHAVLCLGCLIHSITVIIYMHILIYAYTSCFKLPSLLENRLLVQGFSLSHFVARD